MKFTDSIFGARLIFWDALGIIGGIGLACLAGYVTGAWL